VRITQLITALPKLLPMKPLEYLSISILKRKEFWIETIADLIADALIYSVLGT
jgi:hypothetical protein